MLHVGKGRWFLRPVGALQNALMQILRDNAVALTLILLTDGLGGTWKGRRGFVASCRASLFVSTA